VISWITDRGVLDMDSQDPRPLCGCGRFRLSADLHLLCYKCRDQRSTVSPRRRAWSATVGISLRGAPSSLLAIATLIIARLVPLGRPLRLQRKSWPRPSRRARPLDRRQRRHSSRRSSTSPLRPRPRLSLLRPPCGNAALAFRTPRSTVSLTY